MSDMTLERALELEKEAEANNGRCTHCEQTIKIYRYPISRTIKRVIKAIAKATTPDSGRAVDVDRDIEIKHSERSQLSKMRQHGLVAQPKDERGVKISRHWLITRKGWSFLSGEPVPAKVVVYNNQVLGHDGGVTTFGRADADPDQFEQQPISEAESRTFAHIREPEFNKTVQAIWLGKGYSSFLETGKAYDVKMQRLQVGKPIKIRIEELPAEVREISYVDIATFAKYWKVEK